ncbi:hypothetical protein [Streptomyces sp. NPDC055189]
MGHLSETQRATRHTEHPDTNTPAVPAPFRELSLLLSGNSGSRARGESGLLSGDSLASHTVQLNIDGGTETLSEVTGLQINQPILQTPTNKFLPGQQSTGTVTVVRGAARSRQLTALVNGQTQPGTATLNMLDYAGNPTKRYSLHDPSVTKDEPAPTGNVQSVTIKFTNLTIG